LRVYDGHTSVKLGELNGGPDGTRRVPVTGNETVSKSRQAERLPCCLESPRGACEQHIDAYMTWLQYDKGVDWFSPGSYRRARNRAAARLSRQAAEAEQSAVPE